MALRDLTVKFTLKTGAAGQRLRSLNAGVSRLTPVARVARAGVDRLSRAIENSGRSSAAAAVQQKRLTSQFQGGALGALQKYAGVLVGLYAGSRLISGITGFIDRLTDQGDQLDKMSRRAGLSVAALQSLEHAATLSGASLESSVKALQKLQVNMFEAAKGTAMQVETFKDAEIEWENADGSLRSVDDVLGSVADALNGTVDPARRLGLATRLMGKGGAQLLPMFEQGAAGLAELRAEYEKLGGGLSREAIQQAADYKDTLQRFSVAALSAKSNIAVFLLPALTSLVEFSTRVSTTFSRVLKDTHLLASGLIVLSAALAKLGIAAIISKFGGLRKAMVRLTAVAKLGAKAFLWMLILALILDDIITFLQGGDSALGAFIDNMFGAGTAAEVVKQISEWWDDVGESVMAVVRTVIEIGAQIAATVIVILGWLAALIGGNDEAAEKMERAFLRVTEGIGKAIDDVFEFLGLIALEAVEEVIAIWDDLGEAAGLVADSIADAFSDAWGSVVESANEAWSKVKGVISDITFGLVSADAAAPATAAPRRPPGAGGSVQQNTFNQTAQVTVGGGAANPGAVARAARSGTLQALGRDRRAILAGVSG
jgi:hypothetical protein